MTTTTARRITRLINHHARATHTRTATMGGIRLYIDHDGNEITWNSLGETFAGTNPADGTAYQWTVHPGGITTESAVQDELDRYDPRFGAEGPYA